MTGQHCLLLIALHSCKHAPVHLSMAHVNLGGRLGTASLKYDKEVVLPENCYLHYYKGGIFNSANIHTIMQVRTGLSCATALCFRLIVLTVYSLPHRKMETWFCITTTRQNETVIRTTTQTRTGLAPWC